MIRNATFLILIEVFFHTMAGCFAQNIRSDQCLNSLDILLGEKVFTNKFMGQINSLNNFSFGKPVSYVGLGFVGSINDGEGIFNDGHITYSHILPDNIIIGNSIKCKISGFNFSLPVLGYNLFSEKYESTDFLISLGFNTGRIRLYGNELVRQQNPYFSPKITMSPRVRISKLVLSLIVEYEYDISSGEWRKMANSNTNKIKLDNYRQSGITAFLSLGYLLVWD